MKKFLLALALGAALVLVTFSLASANGGPHGGYTATTDACAGCHRAHTATGPQLLTEATTFDLCIACHGTAGTGADTNVADGFFLSTRSTSTEGEANTVDNAPLLAGGFTNYGGAATTSTHDVTNTVTDAWGNGADRGVVGAMAGGEALSCGSCHDPHGSANYRIIKETVNGNAVTVSQVDEGVANKDYDDEQWPADISNVCAACHGSYHVTAAGSGSDAVEAANGGYTHRVDMSYSYGGNVNPETVGFGGFNLPLADSGTGDLVACSTCHLAHGSSAAMTAGGPADGTGVPGETSATDSALLRLDNRGVCEVCHQK
jgi:predicted CXXCH cytochrome family protein